MTPDQFQPRWMLRDNLDGFTHYQRPNSVFKYMNQNYIDDFFKDGTLKLGSFKEYKSIEDSTRNDVQEGTNEFIVWNKNRTHHKTLRRFTGNHNLIFCTSATNNFKLLSNKFQTNGYFRINNTLGFAYELANSIKGFVKGLEGPAIYTGSGQTNFYTENYKVPDFNEDTPMHEIFETFDLISKVNFDQYFSKRITPFSIENEYRLIWLLDHEPNIDELIIKCPDARRFCEKIT